MNAKLIFFMFLIVILLSGCNKENDTVEISMEENKMNDQAIAIEAEKKIEQLKEVTDALAISTDKELLIAFKVKHFERFHLKQIEKKVKEKLKKEFPDKEPLVSSDLKIFIETTKLKSKLKSQNYSHKKLQQDFLKIVKLSQEQT